MTGAAGSAANGRLVMSTDGHVISPLFFPGGDIGSLSVHGTMNDVAMTGCTAALSDAAFHSGGRLSAADLERIVISMARAAKAAGVPVMSPATPRWSKRARATACS
jgi:hydrogenase expression/formation protein HypE